MKFSEKEQAYMLALLKNVAVNTYFECIKNAAPFSMSSLRVSTADERVSQLGRMADLSPEDVEVRFASLWSRVAPEQRAGVAVAHVVCVAQLARLGRVERDRVKILTDDAVGELFKVDHRLARSFLMDQLATAWMPDDHANDPVKDFGQAARLLRDSIALQDGVDKANVDTVFFLARALRYSEEGNLQENLREARRLFRLRLKMARQYDGPEYTANVLVNLAELESQIGDGSQLERLQASEELVVEALKLSTSKQRQAEYTAFLAWKRTEIGAVVGGEEGVRKLEKALKDFESVEVQALLPGWRENVANNRLACEATLASLRRENYCDEIEIYRRGLADINAKSSPYAAAVAKHNLGKALIFHSKPTREHFVEGLDLLRSASQVRTIEANPRHCWETAYWSSRAILSALAYEDGHFLSMSEVEAIRKAESWLEQAVAAARVLGPGEEQLLTAFALCEFAQGMNDATPYLERTERAWKLVRASAAHTLLHSKMRDREAMMATNTAVVAFMRAVTERLMNAQRDPDVMAGLFRGESILVLRDSDAEAVARWALRAQQPAKRPLAARLERPSEVPNDVLNAWNDALNSRDERIINEALDEVRHYVPGFLDEDQENEGLWAWVGGRTGRTAVSVVLQNDIALILIMNLRNDGSREIRALGVPAETPPVPLSELQNLMSDGLPKRSDTAKLEQLAMWLRLHIADPVEKVLGAQPAELLWIPDPELRTVPPKAIWPNSVIETSSSLWIPNQRNAPSRPNSSLLVLADPGPLNDNLDLKGLGVPGLQQLRLAALERGPVSQIASVGDAYGSAVVKEGRSTLNVPASISHVLNEAEKHGTIVILAHGEAKDAALLLVDEMGKTVRLDVAYLRKAPEAFLGATVILLACESGRMGSSRYEPGGIAGTLLSSGASRVIAPLWPVRLDVATEVGTAVLRGLAAGETPAEALAQMQLRVNGVSPHLGRPSQANVNRSEQKALHHIAFVSWVG